MHQFIRLHIISSLLLLIATLVFGLLASWAFLFPETYNQYLPFYQLRPFHVSAALFWIISGASACIMHFKNDAFGYTHQNRILEKLYITSWIGTILAIFTCYALKQFGGREYWEFPPVLCLPLLISWVLLMGSYFLPWFKSAANQPMYVWMWSTGLLFFLLTFLEQNLWQIPWFRQSYLREVTVQWKANGSSVGAWNQILYGTSLYLMVKISGNENIARGYPAFFFYILGLSNLMFNWGHHVYNLPASSWIRDTSYLISMTEWVFFIRIVQGFKNTLDDRRRYRNLVTYRYLIASEFWVFLNLLLALLMSVPAINRYTHGTHFTVAHAMGTTMGINTMILLAGFSYMLGIDKIKDKAKKIIGTQYWICQFSLGIFWFSLIAAGTIKGYMVTFQGNTNFQEVMVYVSKALTVSSIAGAGLLISLGTIAVVYIRQAISMVVDEQ